MVHRLFKGRMVYLAALSLVSVSSVSHAASRLYGAPGSVCFDSLSLELWSTMGTTLFYVQCSMQMQQLVTPSDFVHFFIFICSFAALLLKHVLHISNIFFPLLILFWLFTKTKETKNKFYSITVLNRIGAG